MPLRKGHQVKIIPLTVACDPFKRHAVSAIEVFRNKRFGSGMSQPAHQAQSFIWVVQWRQGMRHSCQYSRSSQKAQRSELHLGRGRKVASLKEPVHTPVVHMLG